MQLWTKPVTTSPRRDGESPRGGSWVDVAASNIDCTWVIGLRSPEATVEEAVARQADGFRTFKVKVGDNDDDDLQKVMLVREALGPQAVIRLDANGAYEPDRALRVFSSACSATTSRWSSSHAQPGSWVLRQHCAASWG